MGASHFILDSTDYMRRLRIPCIVMARHSFKYGSQVSGMPQRQLVVAQVKLLRMTW